MDKLSYALGLGIGRQLSDMGAKGLSIEDFAQAIKDVIAGAEPQIGDQEAQTIVQEFFQEQEKKQRAAAAEKLGRESKERPNDPISQRGLKDSLTKLESIQEAVK